MPAPDDHERRSDASETSANFERQRRAVATQLAQLPLFANLTDEADTQAPSAHLVVGMLFMPVRSWKELLISASAGAFVEATESDLVKAGTTTAVGFTVTALRTLKRMKTEELVTFTVMQKLSAGAVYRVWLDEAAIVEALTSELGPVPAVLTLANMKSRGILEEGAGKWRAVL